ncbi:glycosyltransferase [Candidatus Micrarchaeota archaeon]|nr:glycosyltransferase [Candidatus Micrarchaeota archaeon]
MKLSVIVPTLNEERVIENTLKELRKRVPRDAEFIVSDGDSSDHTRQIAKKYAKIVWKHIDFPYKKSIAAGRNAGAKAAKGEILLFNDADTMPSKAFVEEALEVFRMQPEVASVGCNIMPLHESCIANVFFKFLNLIVRVAGSLGQPAISGNCVFYRAASFWKAKGFDESMFASEDQDLSRRMAKIGRVVLLPQHTAYTSSRRLKKMGWVGLLLDWGKTTFNYVFGIKTKRYAIVREI